MVSSAGPVARWNDSMKTWMKDAIMATEKMSCLPEVIDVAGILESCIHTTPRGSNRRLPAGYYG
jgi:hypothetical protein